MVLNAQEDPAAANFRSLLSLMGTEELSDHAEDQEAGRVLSAELKARLNAALQALSLVRRSCEKQSTPAPFEIRLVKLPETHATACGCDAHRMSRALPQAPAASATTS